MIKLFYSVDCFCPKPYFRQSNENFFFIFQLFYFSDGVDDIKDVIAKIQKNEITCVPLETAGLTQEEHKHLIFVPPPPNSSIQLSFKGSAVAINNGFEFSTIADKVEWIKNNYSFLTITPLAENLKYVSDKQLVTLKNWLIAQATFHFNLQNPQGEELTIKDHFHSIHSTDLAEVVKTIGQDVPSATKKYLALNLKEEKNIPPQLKFTQEKLDELKRPENVADATKLLGQEKNFRNILYNAVLDEINKRPAANPADVLWERMNFYFGMGERLRILQPLSPTIMNIIDEDEKNDGGKVVGTSLIITNNYSLCGMVFSVPVSTLVPDATVSIKITDRLNSNLILEVPSISSVTQSVNFFITAIATAKPENFKLDVSLLNTPLQGASVETDAALAYYLPKTQGLIDGKKSIEHNNTKFNFRYVPTGLLDALSPAARSNTNHATRFLHIPDQRMFIKGTEVFKHDVDVANLPDDMNIFNLVRAIELDVSIQRTFLPQGNMFFCKLFKKANLENDQEEREALLKILSAQNTPVGEEKPDTDILFFIKVAEANNYKPITIFYKTSSQQQLIGWDEDELIECYFEDNTIKFENDSVQATLLLVSQTQLEHPDKPIERNDKFFLHGFNTLLDRADENKTVLGLDNAYEFKFNRSVNALKSIVKLHAFSDSYTPSPLIVAGKSDPLLLDFSNFNKLRLYLEDSQRNRLLLNSADALVPVKEELAIDINIQRQLDLTAFYQLTHRFSDEAATENKDIAETDATITAEENAYSLYRSSLRDFKLFGMAENQYAFRKLVNGNTITLPYSQTIKNPANASVHEKIVQDQETNVKWQGFIEHEIVTDAGVQKLRLRLNKMYLNLLLKDDTGAGGASKRIRLYRDLYQQIFDAFNNDLSVAIEFWVFDNVSKQVHEILPADAGHPEKSNKLPGMMDNLVKESLKIIKLTNADKEKLFKNLFAQKTFVDFKKFVESADLSANIIDLNIVPLTGDEFRIVRISLQIDRPQANTVNILFEGNPVTETLLMPVPPGVNEQGIVENKDKYKRFDQASQFLKKYIEKNDENSLYHLNNHIVSAEHRTSDKKFAAMLLGETKPYSLVCPQKQIARENVLHYIPYGFKGLQVPADFNNSGNHYNDFIEYMVRVMDYLVYPEFTKGNPKDFLIDIKDETDEKLVFARKIAARKLLISLAQKLGSLVANVDNRSDESTNAEYNKVIQKTKADTKLHGTIANVVASVFIENPLTYIDAKAIGIGLFDKLQKDLYLVESKKIIAKDATETHQAEESSGTNFKGFFTTDKNTFYAEVLQNAIYDNEFEISAKDTKGRTALDVIKGDDFNAPVRIPHFCPDWILKQGAVTREFYLLPSRKMPAIPVPSVPAEHLIKRNFDNNRAEEWKTLVKKRTASTDNIIVSIADKPTEFQSKMEPAVLRLTAEGFTRNDQFLSTYDFLVRPDEEASLENDSFEIEVEENTEDGGLQLNNEPEVPVKVYELTKQFERAVLKKKESMDAVIDGDVLLKEMEDIIAKMTPLSTVQEVQKNPVYTLSLSGIAPNLKANLRLGKDAVDLRPHSVVAAEIFEVKTGPANLFLIRLKVFANPWTKCRIRLRARRNMRDLDNDQRFDINPELVINSNWSPWIDYNWQTLYYDYWESLQSQLGGNVNNIELPESLRLLKPTNAALTRDSYRKNIREGKAIDLGNSVISSTTLNVDKAMEAHGFNCRVYEVSGSNGFNIYNNAKKDSVIVNEHIEKINFNGKAWIESKDGNLQPLSTLPASVISFEPVYDITWYSKKDGIVPVFSLKLKLELT